VGAFETGLASAIEEVFSVGNSIGEGKPT